MNIHGVKTKIFKRVGFVIGGIILAVALAFVFGIIVLYLWNWLMPELFGLKEITYLQAWGLVLLSHILFKSGGHGSPHQHKDFRRKIGREHKIGEHLREKFQNEEYPEKTE